MDSWTVVRGKNDKKNAPRKNAPKPEKKEPEEVILLNKVFEQKSSSSELDDNDSKDVDYTLYQKPEPVSSWTTVSNPKSRKKNQKKKEKVEEKQKEKEVKKTKPKKAEKPESQILKEKDERRARKELKSGDSCMYYYEFEGRDMKAKITSTTADSLTITFDGIQRTFKRTDRIIKPIWNEKRRCYMPFPKKEKKKKAAAEPEPKKEKKKKPKKKGPKKVTTENAILDRISIIIQNYGSSDKLGLPEIMNHLRDHLQGGSWNQKKYKQKFGTMKKFLQKHKERFVVTEVKNGGVEITRLPPPPPKLKKDPSIRGSPKAATPRESSGSTSFVFMFIVFVLLFIIVCYYNKDESVEILKKIQGRLEVLFSSSSTNREL